MCSGLCDSVWPQSLNTVGNGNQTGRYYHLNCLCVWWKAWVATWKGLSHTNSVQVLGKRTLCANTEYLAVQEHMPAMLISQSFLLRVRPRLAKHCTRNSGNITNCSSYRRSSYFAYRHFQGKILIEIGSFEVFLG